VDRSFGERVIQLASTWKRETPRHTENRRGTAFKLLRKAFLSRIEVTLVGGGGGGGGGGWGGLGGVGRNLARVKGTNHKGGGEGKKLSLTLGSGKLCENTAK